MTAACLCGCPPDLHIGDIGCPCALPGEPPCVTWLDAATVPPGDAPIYAQVCREHGTPAGEHERFGRGDG